MKANVIYFDQDSKANAKEYAEHARVQRILNNISDGIDKTAIVTCSVTSVLAIVILVLAICM